MLVSRIICTLCFVSLLINPAYAGKKKPLETTNSGEAENPYDESEDDLDTLCDCYVEVREQNGCSYYSYQYCNFHLKNNFHPNHPLQQMPATDPKQQAQDRMEILRRPFVIF